MPFLYPKARGPLRLDYIIEPCAWRVKLESERARALSRCGRSVIALSNEAGPEYTCADMIFARKDKVVGKVSCPFNILFLLVWITSVALSAGSGDGIADMPFVQEYHEAFPLSQKNGSNDVRAVAVDTTDRLWVGTRAGVYGWDRDTKQWISFMGEKEAGPVYEIAIGRTGTVWFGAWNGLYHSTQGGLKKLEQIDCPVPALCTTGGETFGMGGGGIWRVAGNNCTFGQMPYSKHFRAVLSDKNGGLWIATGMGLYHHRGSDYKLYQTQSELLGPDVRDVAFARDGSLWIGGLGGITVYRDGKRIGSFTPKDGLPSISIQCLVQGPDGRIWVGTDRGVARYDGQSWSLRHSRRWLLSDDVRDIAFDSQGTAWIATGAGVSAIKRKSMTMAEKADYFLNVCLTRHVREPGLVEKCSLRVPGDTSTWEPRDDDNDGQYTAMYLAMESFRYAATKDPQAKANAKKAFEALRFLQTVTETPGFVARTVIPGSWTKMADPNRKISDRQWAEMVVDNPREKRVETRWRPSRDGKWLWKGDTSSDEITGHMFGYLFYYDLVADEAERRHVARHILNIVDYIIESGYVLRGMDGRHTKWGVWEPEKLNEDPDWAPERGINSVEILSFLKLAYHVSGDERYQKEYMHLLNGHDYASNVRRAKTTNPTWRTHIDDELLALAYPCLMMHEDDPKLRRLYRESVDHWYAAVKADCSPFFEYIYGACIGEVPQPDVSVASLRDASFDLVRWTVDNSHREDIRIVRTPEWEHLQTDRLLPPSERGVIRWDENPWRVVQGDGGHTESDGVWWLLPYWMGRYYGYIQPPQ
jgi:streptogramin lyase